MSHAPNRLGNEKSPYLLQHALNPVDWFPWGDEAFEKATSGLKAGAQRARTSNAYKVFDANDIRTIFEAKRYLENNRASDDFWVPLVGLYTGARLGEIVTLTPDAVVLESQSKLYCMNVGTKNDNSKRLVPVPATLIELAGWVPAGPMAR